MSLSAIDRLLCRLEGLLLLAAIATLLVLTAGTVYAVAMRYLFGVGVSWAIELGEYMVLFLGFLAAADVDRGDGHVTSGLLLNLLPQEGRRPLTLAGRVVITGVLGVFAWYAVWATADHYVAGTVIYNIMFIQEWLVYLPPTLGMLLLLLRSALKTALLATESRGVRP